MIFFQCCKYDKCNMYQLHCSKNAVEILELARTILDEARDSSDACAVRLFYTCRNVFGMYAWLVPEHHRKFLDTIPQQVGKTDTIESSWFRCECEIFIVAIACVIFAALFHNNCMYLAHHLLTLAHDCRDKFSKNLQKLNLTFADQVTVLRDVGSRYFLEHMRYQRNIIFDIIKDSGSCALTLSIASRIRVNLW